MSPSYVLVTGATGFLGAHVVDTLLKRGLKVRAVARSKAKADRMLKDRPQYADKLDFYFIDDLLSPGVFDDAVKGIDGVVHCASPLKFNVQDREKELMLPAIQGVKSMLEASAKSGTVKRVVLTSSYGGIVDIAKTEYTYTSKDWSPVEYKDAIDPASNGGVAYRGSKKFAEKAAWAFVEEQKPAFDIVTICPSMIFGPYVNPHDSPDDLCESSAVMWRAVAGGGDLGRLNTDEWIDVRDLAEIHVLALETPQAGNKRYIPVAPEKYTYQMAADLVRESFPEWPAERIASGSQQVNPSIRIDRTDVLKDFPSVKYTPFKDTATDFFKQAAALEKGGAK